MPISQTGKNLIFLISQPRSGSTLLQRVLAGHPEIHTTAEPWLMLPLIYTFRSSGIQTEYDHTLAQSAVVDFLKSLKYGDQAYKNAISAAAALLYQQACKEAGKSIFLDKTPRYYLILEDLHQLFPEAKFILLFRHPLAVLNSILETHVKGNWILLHRYRNDLITAPRQLILAKRTFGRGCFCLQYEDFVRRPEQTAKSLFDFLDLSFSESYLYYSETTRPAGKLGDQKTIEAYSFPNPARIDRWHQLVSHPQTLHFARAYLAELGDDLVSQMGYSAMETRQILASQPPPERDLPFLWNDLFAENSPYRSRIFYSELALLEHRRLVFAIRNLIRRVRGD